MRLCIALFLFVLSACSSPAPKCWRLTLIKEDVSRGIFLPHWHLVPGDIVLSQGDQVVVVFPNGRRLVAPAGEVDLVEEGCE